MNVQQNTAVDTSALYATLNNPEREIVLLPEAREITENWLAYLTAQSEIENFQAYTVKEVSDNGGVSNGSTFKCYCRKNADEGLGA